MREFSTASDSPDPSAFLSSKFSGFPEQNKQRRALKWNAINTDHGGIRSSLKTDGLLGSTHAMEPVLYSRWEREKESRMHASLVFKALLCHSNHAQVRMVSVTCASPQGGVVSISPYRAQPQMNVCAP